MVDDKFSYVVKIYIVLVIQIISTFLVIWNLRKDQTSFSEFIENFNIFIYVALVLIIVIIFSFLSNKYFYTKLLLFSLFAFIKACIIYIGSKDLDQDTLETAFISTILTFGAMTFIAYILYRLGYNIHWIGLYLFVALIGLIIAHIVMLFKKPDNQTKRGLVYIGIVLFSLFVMYDTNNVLIYRMNTYNDDYLTPAMEFYIDFFALFRNYLRLEE